MKTRKLLRIVLPILFLVFATAFAAQATPSQLNATQTPVDPYGDMLNGYQTLLARTDLSPQERENLENQMKPWATAATERAKAMQERAEGKGLKITRTPRPVKSNKLPDGIDERAIKPHFSSAVHLTNAWRKTVGDITYLVYAGVMDNDLTQGIVYRQVPGDIGFIKYPCPKKSGALRIVNETNLRLTLSSEAGDTFYFDVITAQFIDAIDAPVFTPTPGP